MRSNCVGLPTSSPNAQLYGVKSNGGVVFTGISVATGVSVTFGVTVGVGVGGIVGVGVAVGVSVIFSVMFCDTLVMFPTWLSGKLFQGTRNMAARTAARTTRMIPVRITQT